MHPTYRVTVGGVRGRLRTAQRFGPTWAGSFRVGRWTTQSGGYASRLPWINNTRRTQGPFRMGYSTVGRKRGGKELFRLSGLRHRARVPRQSRRGVRGWLPAVRDPSGSGKSATDADSVVWWRILAPMIAWR
jgi:hypothetical protein